MYSFLWFLFVLIVKKCKSPRGLSSFSGSSGPLQELLQLLLVEGSGYRGGCPVDLTVFF